MSFFWIGLLGIAIFYILILLVGFWAAKKTKNDQDSEEVMLAGRNIGMVVGIFTMTATWVGGGYINGTAEVIYRDGLIWCQAPFGYALSLVFGGILFAEKMRTKGYVTMLDPFQIKFGEKMGALLFLPALLGEVFWSAAILSALGATLSVILDIRDEISIIVSACIAVFYTFFGGLYSVAYTDVVQLFCIFVGLWVCIPPALSHAASARLEDTYLTWTGEQNLTGAANLPKWGGWVDAFLLLTFGGIPWQVYFQRVLSSKSAFRAKMLSYVAAFGCFIMAIPSVIIGAVAKSTNWTQTEWRLPNGSESETIPDEMMKLTLPLVLRYLTPMWIAFIGLGAVSAAVMSSADSSILSAASMFARNIWKLGIRHGASEREVIIVMKVTVIIVGIFATIIAIMVKTIYGLWALCSDLVYVILFPQLLCVVYMDKSNTYGALSAYTLGLLIRILGGEPLIFLPAGIHYAGFDYENQVQNFPHKTLAMLISLSTMVGVSLLTDYLFNNNILPMHYDIFQCVVNIPIERRILKDPSMATSTDTLAALSTHKANQAIGNNKYDNGSVNPLLLSANYNNDGLSTASSSAATPIREERAPLNAETKFTYSSLPIE